MTHGGRRINLPFVLNLNVIRNLSKISNEVRNKYLSDIYRYLYVSNLSDIFSGIYCVTGIYIVFIACFVHARQKNSGIRYFCISNFVLYLHWNFFHICMLCLLHISCKILISEYLDTE